MNGSVDVSDHHVHLSIGVKLEAFETDPFSDIVLLEKKMIGASYVRNQYARLNRNRCREPC